MTTNVSARNDRRRVVAETGISAWLNVGVRGWRAASVAVALTVAAPILVVAAAWFTPATDIWRHIADTVLAELLAHTAVLALGVGFGVLVLGTALAWLVATCEFPGRKFFDWALMLPLAIPAYVLA
ncbi:MAG: iron ABC transporter permease, partial [Gammaproteobacteria bacterium]